jgi:hypothetical protein
MHQFMICGVLVSLYLRIRREYSHVSENIQRAPAGKEIAEVVNDTESGVDFRSILSISKSSSENNADDVSEYQLTCVSHGFPKPIITAPFLPLSVLHCK